MHEPYNPYTAGPRDRIAWALCQILDADAPLRRTRYRFAADCLAANATVLSDLQTLATLTKDKPL